jgi:hypothetical protein
MNARKVAWSLVSVLALATTLPGVAIAAGKGPCAELSFGGGKGVCQAFCNARNCDAKSTEPKACEQLRRVFERLTGSSIFPCEAPLGTNKSGPIDITADGRKVAAVNTDTDTVSFFEVQGDGMLTKAAEVPVGDEPRSVATLLRKPLAYVANTVSGPTRSWTPSPSARSLRPSSRRRTGPVSTSPMPATIRCR